MLYAFEQLSKRLDELGYPKVQGRGRFKTIRTDFKKAYHEGNIIFKEDGIYLSHEGNEWRGYMYMPKYRVGHYNDFPRFHLTKCDVINGFIKNNLYNTYYEWSNHKTNDITDRDIDELYPNQTLQLCRRCTEQLKSKIKIKDTKDFFNTLDTEEQNNNEIQVDILGYTRDFNRISRAYRERQNYTCEECGVVCREKPLHERWWWHTHHIDGNKTNNNPNNLKCLCIACHADVDERHRKNFASKAMQIQLESFREEYGNELRN